MADNKLEIEIIDDGDGGVTSLSPDDFSSIREFNKALARLKAEVRAQEFEATQELKARKAALKDQKLSFDEQKQVRKLNIEDTKLQVQERKAKKQLDVVIEQERRAKEARENKTDRHREMMLRHVLGALNPNSTFQYRMSSIYGLINTARNAAARKSEDDESESGDSDTREKDKVMDIVKDSLNRLREGLQRIFSRNANAKFANVTSQSVSAAVNAQRTSGMAAAATSPTATSGSSIISPSGAAEASDDSPWWWNYRPKGFQATTGDKLRIINQKMLPGPGTMTGFKPSPTGGSPVPAGAPPVAGPGPGGYGSGNIASLTTNLTGGGGAGMPPSPVGGGAGAGGAGGGAAATGFRMFGMSLGKLAIAAGVVVGGLLLAAVAVRYLAGRFTDAADKVRVWSSSLIASGINSQMRFMQQDIRRGQQYGAGLAEFENSQTSLTIALTDMMDSITMPFLPLISGIYDFISEIAGYIKNIADGVAWLLGIQRGTGQSGANDIAANLANFLNAPMSPQRGLQGAQRFGFIFNTTP
jgi:hypothetical protein